MIKLILTLMILVYSSISMADQYLLLGSWSRHHDTEYGYNETHKLIGYERNNYSVGRFINSENDPTYFVGYSQKFNYGFKLNYALVYGYDRVKLFPIVVPSVTIGRGRLQLDLNYVPAVVFTAGFRVKIN